MSDNALRQDLPLVSVALCTYNGARYLREQLDSLARQTYPRLEFIVVDDASTDETGLILEEYARRLPLRIYRNESNLGYIKNFEKAIALSTGTFIAPCDQDDIWLPEKIAALVDFCRDKLLVYCDAELIDPQGQPLHKFVSDVVNPVRSSAPNQLLFSNCAPGHTLLFHRDLLGAALPFPPQVPHDWWLLYTAATLGRIGYLPAPLVLYRQHPANVTNFSHHKKEKERDLKKVRRSRELYLLSQFKSFNDRQGIDNPVLNQLISRLTHRSSRGLDLKLLAFLYQHQEELYFVLKKSKLKKIHRIFKESLA
jgi:glycosyltransferase involved in cell wall biosynthesis